VPTSPSHCRSTDELLETLSGLTQNYFDGGIEHPLSVLDHSLQCAAVVADTDPTDTELQVAALVHDIGFALPGPESEHALTAASWLRRLFGPRITAAVAWHDVGERHLLSSDSQYRRRLHPASGLRGQHPLTAVESALFLRQDGAHDAVIVARANAQSCAIAHRPPALESWIGVLEAHSRAVVAV
jgi:predicted HD phosphohydrolase